MMKIKDLFKKKDKEKPKSNVVTQANLEESRDEVLAKGKKFRYPFQYAKHRLMINAVLVGLLAVAVFVFVGWLQLFKMNNTGDVIYRFTRVIPVTVAEVDGVKVRFSDYLMLYRSSVASIERQQGKFEDSEEARSQLAYYQRQALNSAEESSYAMAKLAELGKSVTEEEIDEIVNKHRMIDGELRSEETFATIVENNFGLSMKEYRRMVELSLAKKKYSIETDKTAKKIAKEVAAKLKENSGDMSKIMADYPESDLVFYETTASQVSVNNLDGGRADVAYKLENKGDISEAFVSASGDGYYLVKMTDKGENTVAYDSIWVRFSTFDKEIASLRENGAVVEKVTIEVDFSSDELEGGIEMVPAEDAESDAKAD